MNMKRTLLTSAIVGLFFSLGAVAADLTDQYDPFVTSSEISAVPSMPTRAEERIADQYNPFILSNEIVVTEGCVNPAQELVASQYQPFVTLAELQTAEKQSTC